ncbi:hypothetical protein LZ32DRAFT_220150 [Colletotrichum eremochloae]|nr:hypothetical protein LZ32DRAFT_220150 [Colletotrichum eremochloae]
MMVYDVRTGLSSNRDSRARLCDVGCVGNETLVVEATGYGALGLGRGRYPRDENLVLRRQACRHEETSLSGRETTFCLYIHIRVSRLDGETGTMSPSERGVLLSFAVFYPPREQNLPMAFQVLHVKPHTTFVLSHHKFTHFFSVPCSAFGIS